MIMTSKWTRLCAIGVLVVLTLGLVETALPKSNSKAGKGALEGFWVMVTVENISYERDYGWTQSYHWYDMRNLTGDTVEFTIEFQHEVAGIKNGKRVPLGLSSTYPPPGHEHRDIDSPDYKSEDGTQGVNCNGLPAGNYLVDAYTSVRVSDPGVMSVDVSDDTFRFTIRR